MSTAVAVDERDLELLDKVEVALEHGLDETKAINLFASFTLDEYDRMIILFDSELESGLDDTTRDQIIKVLKALREKKAVG
jgi:hypothetical protein